MFWEVYCRSIHPSMFFQKSREQALSRENEPFSVGQSDNSPLGAASAVMAAGRAHSHSRPMFELEVRGRFMALPTRPFAFAALCAPFDGAVRLVPWLSGTALSCGLVSA